MAVLVAASALAGVVGCVDPDPAGSARRTGDGDAASDTTVIGPSPDQADEPPAAPVPGGAGALVDQLVVVPEAGADSYQRDLFGGGWIDADGDGCDTRAEVLIAESLTPAQVDPYGCAVTAGDWLSSYDGYTTTDPTELEIDHVVALAEAWRSGASQWDSPRRLAFANDLDEPSALIAVTASTNRSKSDRDPASWQPPSTASWCGFATAWVTVKVRWALTADQAEVDALRNMLAPC